MQTVLYRTAVTTEFGLSVVDAEDMDEMKLFVESVFDEDRSIDAVAVEEWERRPDGHWEIVSVSHIKRSC